ncbi:hypothetical protein OXPF_12860 [Oxobacter pfennigii]|uniref:Uncharacterized protein n=1 Tax=Oxobacter pfennigii TaxID=36849 RepID=A0A0P8WB55_9CLOT|nr:hypothetical protein [Oxobacter pfennigii]KPU45159.1 hypothetical protein OXPF_12860 [Oxobacter pfennigii]
MKTFKKISLLFCALLIIAVFYIYNCLVYKEDISTFSNYDNVDINTKIKTAILGDGIIDLNEEELNAAAALALRDNENVKAMHIDIQESKVLFKALVHMAGRELMVKAVVTPVMKDGDIIASIDSVTVGRLKLPDILIKYGISRYLPQGMAVTEDGSINAGNRILMLDGIENMILNNDNIKIVLQQTLPGFEDFASNETSSAGSDATEITPQQGNTSNQSQSNNTGKTVTQKPSPTITQAGSNQTSNSVTPTPTQGSSPNPAIPTVPAEADTQKKISALKTTNSQLYNVQNAVKNSSAKNWVGWVISVNSKMIGNPNGNFSSDINSAKSAYKSFSADIKDEIKSAAINNLDISAVRYLVNVYGM